MTGAAAAVLCALAPAVAVAAFVDPLDEPARPSALAERALVNGLAAAGGRLVAVGERGHALWSDDGGERWTQAAVPVSADLTAVHLATPRRGWAVGHGAVVLATVDGGVTWTRQLDGRDLAGLLGAAGGGAEGGGCGDMAPAVRFLAAQGPATPLLDVWFEDERNGFAVGGFGLVLRTADGGRTWSAWVDRTENPEGLHLYAIRRAAGQLWIAGERGLLLRLDPAAGCFRAAPSPWDGTFFGIVAAGGALLVHGLRGRAFRSGDGGATWRPVETGVETALAASAVSGDGRVVLASLGGDVLVSEDGGETFGRRARARPAASVAIGPRGIVVAGPAGLEAGE